MRAERQERQRHVRHVVTADARKQRARFRPGDADSPSILGAQRPHRDAPRRQVRLEPAHVVLLGDAGTEYEERLPPALPTVKSPISLPLSFNIGESVNRPSRGSLLARICSSQAPAPGPVTSYLAKLEISDMPTALRTARHSSPTCPCAFERRYVTSSRACMPFGANHSACSSPNTAPKTAPLAFRRSYIGVIRSGRAAGSSSFGKRMLKRRE